MNLEDYIKDLSPEVQEKARACKSFDELLDLAEEQGIPVPDDKLEAVAGGKKRKPKNCGELKCPKCGGESFDKVKEEYWGYCIRYLLRCRKCGYEFWYDEWC